jgi:hypothetical protein
MILDSHSDGYEDFYLLEYNASSEEHVASISEAEEQVKQETSVKQVGSRA